MPPILAAGLVWGCGVCSLWSQDLRAEATNGPAVLEFAQSEFTIATDASEARVVLRRSGVTNQAVWVDVYAMLTTMEFAAGAVVRVAAVPVPPVGFGGEATRNVILANPSHGAMIGTPDGTGIIRVCVPPQGVLPDGAPPLAGSLDSTVLQFTRPEFFAGVDNPSVDVAVRRVGSTKLAASVELYAQLTTVQFPPGIAECVVAIPIVFGRTSSSTPLRFLLRNPSPGARLGPQSQAELLRTRDVAPARPLAQVSPADKSAQPRPRGDPGAEVAWNSLFLVVITILWVLWMMPRQRPVREMEVDPARSIGRHCAAHWDPVIQYVCDVLQPKSTLTAHPKPGVMREDLHHLVDEATRRCNGLTCTPQRAWIASWIDEVLGNSTLPFAEWWREHPLFPEVCATPESREVLGKRGQGECGTVFRLFCRVALEVLEKAPADLIDRLCGSSQGNSSETLQAGQETCTLFLTCLSLAGPQVFDGDVTQFNSCLARLRQAIASGEDGGADDDFTLCPEAYGVDHRELDVPPFALQYVLLIACFALMAQLAWCFFDPARLGGPPFFVPAEPPAWLGRIPMPVVLLPALVTGHLMWHYILWYQRRRRAYRWKHIFCKLMELPGVRQQEPEIDLLQYSDWLLSKRETGSLPPVFIVLGQSGTGKSHTLRAAFSRLGWMDSMSRGNALPIVRGLHATFWCTAGGIFVELDLPEDGEEATAACRQSQHELICWLRHLNPMRLVSGILVARGVDSLLQERSERSRCESARYERFLVEIVRGLDVRCPVYLLITKADRLAGYREVFARSRSGSGDQIVGWSRQSSAPDGGEHSSHRRGDPLDEPLTEGQLQNGWMRVADSLCRCRLASLARPWTGDLWEERAARRAAFVLPENVRRLIVPLVKCCDPWFGQTERQYSRYFDDSATALFFRGVYLCSAMQQGPPIDASSLRLPQSPDLPGHSWPPQRWNPNGSSFLADLFRCKIQPEAGLVTKVPDISADLRKRKRKVVCALVVFGLISLGFGCLSLVPR